MLNIALLAPMPTPNVSTTRMVNAGRRSELLSAYRMSWSMVSARFVAKNPEGVRNAQRAKENRGDARVEAARAIERPDPA
jgi:hypothetical protein